MNKTNKLKFMMAMDQLINDVEFLIKNIPRRRRYYGFALAIKLKRKIKLLKDVFDKDMTKNPYHKSKPLPLLKEGDIVMINSIANIKTMLYKPNRGDVGIVVKSCSGYERDINLPAYITIPEPHRSNDVTVEAPPPKNGDDCFGDYYQYDIPRKNLERIA